MLVDADSPDKALCSQQQVSATIRRLPLCFSNMNSPQEVSTARTRTTSAERQRIWNMLGT